MDVLDINDIEDIKVVHQYFSQELANGISLVTYKSILYHLVKRQEQWQWFILEVKMKIRFVQLSFYEKIDNRLFNYFYRFRPC